MESDVGMGMFEMTESFGSGSVPTIVEDSEHFVKIFLLLGVLDELFEREIANSPALMVKEGVVDVKGSKGAGVPNDFWVGHSSVMNGLVESNGDLGEWADSGGVGKRRCDGSGEGSERNHFE